MIKNNYFNKYSARDIMQELKSQNVSFLKLLLCYILRSYYKKKIKI